MPFAKQLLQLREDAARKASAVHHGRSLVFRFGYSPFVSRGIVQEALQGYKDLVPNGTAEQFRDGSAALAKMVSEGDLDAALVVLPIAGRELLRQNICSERYLVCLRADDPHAAGESLSPECIAANLKIFVSRYQYSSFCRAIEKQLSAAGIKICPTHHVSTPADIQILVQDGQGWGLVHESLSLSSDLVRKRIRGVSLRVKTSFISRKNQEIPLFPMLAFRLARTYDRKPTEIRGVGSSPLVP